MVTPLQPPLHDYDSEAALVEIGDRKYQSMDCHCSSSIFKDQVLNFKNIMRKSFDVLQLINRLEERASLKTADKFCNQHMHLPLDALPNMFWKSLCIYFNQDEENCFKINLKHTKNDDCPNEVIKFLYHLQEFLGNYGLSQNSHNMVKRFVDVEIGGGGSFEEDYTGPININSNNIHLLLRNQRNLNLGQQKLIDAVNKLVASENDPLSTLLPAKGVDFQVILSDLVFSNKLYGSFQENISQMQRVKEQLSLAIYSLNKFLNIQISLFKGSAGSAFNIKFCFMMESSVGCSQNQPEVSVDDRSITWKYNLEKVTVEKSTRFSCVPAKLGISKKDRQLLLSTSSDRRHQLLSNGHLLVMGDDSDEKQNFNPLSQSNVLNIGKCFYNVANQTILVSCSNRATVSIKNGTVFNMDPFKMKLIRFASFPIVVNSLHLDLDSLIKSIESKQFELSYLNDKSYHMVSKKGLSVLIQRKKDIKKIEYQPLLDLIHRNAPTMTYFSVTTAIFVVIGLIITCGCCIRFRVSVWKLVKYLYTCCVTNGRPDTQTNSNLEPAADGLLRDASAPSAALLESNLPAITNES